MSGSFCSMSGMAVSSHTLSHRRLRTSHSDREMPVIVTDDATSGHDTHDTDRSDRDTDRSMDHGMDHDATNRDRSSHGGASMMNSGTVMYMDGFRSALFHSSENPPPCLDLFHPSWRLDTPPKFLLAMAFVTVLGVSVEACGVWRVRCLRKGRRIKRQERLKRQQRQQQQQQLSGDASHADQSRRSRAAAAPPAMFRRAWRTVMPPFLRDGVGKLCGSQRDGSKRVFFIAASLHAVRACLGYLLMLAVMSYAVEFLVCAIAGIVLGRYWFIEVEGDGDGGPVGTEARGQQTAGLSERGDGTWGGGDACCGVDDDDDGDEEFHNNDDNFSLQGSAVNEPLLGSSRMSRRNIT